MAVDRALLVDVLGPDEQDHANAWAARMVQFGQIGGYWMYVDSSHRTVLPLLTENALANSAGASNSPPYSRGSGPHRFK